jgi:regulator of protease activity HflC (stomatin/prohibitin superfamily)
MPLAIPDIIAIHKAFNSADAVQASAVSTMLDAALYLAGPLMTSVESMAERKAELVQVINDQAEHGVYVTKTVRREIEDVAGKREVTASEIVRDDSGRPRRQQGSILGEFKIKLLPMSINRIKYDDVVEKQIAERQSATTQVQIAQANAKRAEQEKLTTEAQGAANAAKAKWEQETIKAKIVTESEQKLKVAELAAKEAEQYKRQQILMGEGDAQRKRLVMEADGALEAKLEVYKDVNRA